MKQNYKPEELKKRYLKQINANKFKFLSGVVLTSSAYFLLFLFFNILGVLIVMVVLGTVLIIQSQTATDFAKLKLMMLEHGNQRTKTKIRKD